MARRNKSSFNDVIEISAMLPWWAGVLLAVISYLGLHWYAGAPVASPASGKAVIDTLAPQMLRAAARFGQYFLPFIFLLGAGLSAYKRYKRRTLHDQVVAGGTRQSIESLSWREFEHLVGEFFRRKGFTVEETGGDGPDGGVDLIASLGKDRYFIQCKQWRARQVGVAIVRELYGVMAAKGAAGGFVVTSGEFTEDAKQFAEGREIKIITGDQLLAEMRGSSPRIAERNSRAESVPLCPKCGAGMLVRTARKGSNIGEKFWGCSTYPACRGIRPA